MTELKDMQGRVISVGDQVAFVGYHNTNTLTIGVVKKLHRVRAEVEYKSLWSSKSKETLNTRGLIKLERIKESA
jgi:hypothetical protein